MGVLQSLQAKCSGCQVLPSAVMMRFVITSLHLWQTDSDILVVDLFISSSIMLTAAFDANSFMILTCSFFVFVFVLICCCPFTHNAQFSCFSSPIDSRIRVTPKKTKQTYSARIFCWVLRCLLLLLPLLIFLLYAAGCFCFWWLCKIVAFYCFLSCIGKL